MSTPKEIAEQLISDATASDSTLKCAENPGGYVIDGISMRNILEWYIRCAQERETRLQQKYDLAIAASAEIALAADQLRAQLAEAQKEADLWEMTAKCGRGLMKCGHQEMWAYSDNGGKTGECLLCVRAERDKLTEALRKLVQSFMNFGFHGGGTKGCCLACDSVIEARAALAELTKAQP